jgi:ABC-2 type transport system ATP-binding protein
VLVSSHLMSELQDTADHLVLVGRGRVIADAGTGELLAAASGDRVMVRTGAGAQAAAVLERAGAAVTVPSPGLLAVSGLASDRVVRVLGESGVPFSEVAAHRASLEEAYLSLTADAVEFRAAAAAGGEGR